jgi:lipopolysaccharide exporter
MRAAMARGAAWMVLFRLFDRSIGVVSTTVLARLLIPADFGLVAMAMSVIAIVELATSFSFEMALIQKADPLPEHFNTAWTLNILMAVGGAIVTAALAFPAASFYGDSRLVAVMFVIGAAWLVSGFENTGVANFRREMNFSAEFRWMASRRVVGFVVTMIAAVAFRSYWALVIGQATGRLMGVVMSYVMQPFRPRFALSRSRELFSFSGWVLIANIAGVALSRLPQIYVGRVFGAQSLGAYSVGSEIAQLAHTELVAPINRAMFPGYARLAQDAESFRRVCIDATAAILLIVLPASAAVAVLAAPVVRVLLGTQWQAAVPIIQILAFSGAIAALNSNNISAYLALGKPYLSVLILITRLLVFVVVVAILSSSREVASVAYAELAASVGCLAVSLPILLRSLRLGVVEYVASLWRPLLASGVGAAAVHLAVGATGLADTLGGAIGRLAIGLAVGAVVYPLTLWVLWRLSGRPAGVELMAGTRIASALRKFVRRAG